MKAIIFAGGVGTRLWPLSRKKSPKQFERLVGDKSTLQLTVERLFPEFKPEDIYVSTGKAYKDLVCTQLPTLPKENVIIEPSKKDVGPAVAFAIGYVAKKVNPEEPVVILWSDHIVKHQDKFKQALEAASSAVQNEKEKIIFIGQKPRFASENLGWIHYGEETIDKNGIKLFSFTGFKYRPNREVANEYFTSNHHCWNLGYFVTTPKFLLSLFEKFVPEIYQKVVTITSSMDTEEFESVLEKEYNEMPVINFDNALLEQLTDKDAYVIVEDIGWSDVGAWEALKEALEDNREDNITNGKVMMQDSKDSLIYNYEKTTLLVGIDLEDMLVINTPDVVLVSKKSSASKIKSLVESFQGTENEDLT